MRLAAMVETVHGRVLRAGIATPAGGRRHTITAGGQYAFGKRMRLGGLPVTLRVSLLLWARHGRSPLWLSLPSSAAAVARRAFPGELIESDGWTAVPIEWPVGTVEDETLDLVVAWLTDAGRRLEEELGGQSPPVGDEDDESSDGSDAG